VRLWLGQEGSTRQLGDAAVVGKVREVCFWWRRDQGIEDRMSARSRSDGGEHARARIGGVCQGDLGFVARAKE